MDSLVIYHRTFIDASPDRVYDTIATGTGWDAWFTQGTTVDARAGGAIRFRFDNFGPDHISLEDGGPVLEAVPAETFAYQWTPGDTTTTVTFRLTPLGKGTLISLTESGYTRSEADLRAYADCAVGWGEALTLLKYYLEHGVTYGTVPVHHLEKQMTEQYALRTDNYKTSTI